MTQPRTPKTRPLAEDIPTDTAWRCGRRIYVRCGYHSALNKEIRDINGTWDPDLRALWVGSGKADKVTALVRAHLARITQVNQVKALGLWVRVPYGARDVETAVRAGQGVFDAARKEWAMPTQDAFNTAQAKVRAHHRSIAEQRAAQQAERSRLAGMDAQQKVADQQQREASMIEKSGRTVIGQGDPGWIDGRLDTARYLRRPDAQRAGPQPGEVRKLRDGRRVLVLFCAMEFYGQDAIDDGFAPFGGTGQQPGWFYRYRYVPVAPTAAEQESDDRQAAEQADAQEIAAVMRAADDLACGNAVDHVTRRSGQTITLDSAGAMTAHDGQITVTASGEVWFHHPGYYDSYVPRQVQITDAGLIQRIRAVVAAGTRRRHRYQVKSEPGVEGD